MTKYHFARHLRKNLTDAERLLWQKLRQRQIYGLKFRRQHPMGQYIIDFVCLESKLVIELDGGQHAEEKTEAFDKKRTTWLEQRGFRVIRFWNHEVLGNLDSVCQEIWNVLELDHPHPNPPPSRGRE